MILVDKLLFFVFQRAEQAQQRRPRWTASIPVFRPTMEAMADFPKSARSRRRPRQHGAGVLRLLPLALAIGAAAAVELSSVAVTEPCTSTFGPLLAAPASENW